MTGPGRLLAAGVLVLVAVLMSSGVPSRTDAAWTTPVTAVASLDAVTVLPPTIVSCTASGSVLAPALSVRWSFPAGSGYSARENLNLYYSNNGLVPSLLPIGSGTTTTGPDSSGVHTTVYDIGLLGGILGTQAAVAFETKLGGWTSPRVTRVATWPLVVGTATCTAP